MKTLLLLVFLLTASLTGCSADAPSLTATLTGADEIRLTWRPAPAGALGQVVEYRNQPTGQFIPLAFLPPDTTGYTHPRLIPKTTFYYRIRTFFGRETPPVPATVSPTAPTPPDPHWAAPRTAPRPPVERRSLHEPGEAGPTDLRAEPAGPDGMHLLWTDHANDEDGYLVEISTANSATTRIAAILAPRINEVGVYPLPAEHTATYRVAAFHYGPTTPTVHQTTS